MEISTAAMPGYRINEYRLVVPLPEALQEKISAIRKGLHEKYGVRQPFGLKPSLTVLKCHGFEKSEAKLLERLQHIAMGTPPFKVELKDYAGYPSHTIYLNVTTKSPFNDLTNELKKAKRLMQIPKHDPHFINEPHLILAQQLKPKQFANMWLECEHRQFTGRFVADALLLLKRQVAGAYEVVRRLELLNLPFHVKQGTLFG